MCSHFWMLPTFSLFPYILFFLFFFPDILSGVDAFLPLSPARASTCRLMSFIHQVKQSSHSSSESMVPCREPFRSSHMKLKTHGCATVGPNAEGGMNCTNKVDIPYFRLAAEAMLDKYRFQCISVIANSELLSFLILRCGHR